MFKFAALSLALVGVALGAQRTAFVVRMAANDKDVSKIYNAVKWAEELRTNLPEVDFWLSIDSTQDHSEYTPEDWSKVPASGSKSLLMAPKDKFNSFVDKDSMKLQKFVTAFQEKDIPLKLHVYTEQDILNAYPHITDARDQSAKACKGEKWCKQPLGWQFHNQALGLWWKDNKVAYDHVWVSESDMDYHGKLHELVEQYATTHKDKDADLVSMISPAWPPQWMWGETGTNAYLQKTSPMDKMLTLDSPLLKNPEQLRSFIQNDYSKKDDKKCMRIATPEYVQRYSSVLLDKLEDYCAGQGMCPHSEQFAPTVAGCEGLKIRGMNPRHLLEVRHDGGPLR